MRIHASYGLHNYDNLAEESVFPSMYVAEPERAISHRYIDVSGLLLASSLFRIQGPRQVGSLIDWLKDPYCRWMDWVRPNTESLGRPLKSQESRKVVELRSVQSSQSHAERLAYQIESR